MSLNHASYYCLLGVAFYVLLYLYTPALCGDSGPLILEHIPSKYYGFGYYYTTCSKDGTQIRCYHYHRHWVCEKGNILYWDRRLEAAARAACGCSMPDEIVPASPAISGKPREGIFGPDE